MLTKALLGIGVAIPTFILYFLKKRHKNLMNTIKNKNAKNEYYYHCYFFTMNNFMCRDHLFDDPCSDNCSSMYLEHVLTLIASARKSILICMYFVTLKEFSDELIRVQRDRDVDIRIITDPVMYKIQKSSFNHLKRRRNFKVKTPDLNDTFMHHKYLLIDQDDPKLGKLLMGSLNLTVQGLINNFDFIVITNDRNIITRYTEEFEYLWNHQTIPVRTMPKGIRQINYLID